MHAFRFTECEWKVVLLFQDSDCNRRGYMGVPFQEARLTSAQKAFSKVISSTRITVEGIFREAKLYFTKFNFKKKMKLLESPIIMIYEAFMLREINGARKLMRLRYIYFVVNMMKIVIQTKYPDFSLCQAVESTYPSH